MSRLREKKDEEPCPPGTLGCLCGQLSELYKSGKLELYRGTVSRERLEEELVVPSSRLTHAATLHPGKAPGRCIRRFDKVLENPGHGTVWTERIPAIREVLERHERAGTLPVNEQGDLNRTAILREFGLGNASVHVIQNRAPMLKQRPDQFDTTRSDPAHWRRSPAATRSRVSGNFCPGTSAPRRTDVKLGHSHRLRNSCEISSWRVPRPGTHTAPC